MYFTLEQVYKCLVPNQSNKLAGCRRESAAAYKQADS